MRQSDKLIEIDWEFRSRDYEFCLADLLPVDLIHLVVMRGLTAHLSGMRMPRGCSLREFCDRRQIVANVVSAVLRRRGQAMVHLIA
jgi:hypothetical protein